VNDHKLRIVIDGDYARAELVCPEDGCPSGDTCGHCGRDLANPEQKPCYDCPDASTTDCWLKSWAENVDLLEYASGQVSFTVPISYHWDGDSPVVELEQPEASA
jgi:hypothetical protein